jgi:hypothetical protein
MSLWGNLDNPTGNQKPLFSNTSTTYGVSVTETANTLGDGPKVTHSGWVKQSIGTGSITSISINVAGTGINSVGFLTISGGGGSNANISYTTANSQNTLQTYSSNPAWNVIASLVINNPGDGFTSAPTVTFTGANITLPTFIATVGGRAGRRFYETLVATGSITEDDSADDTYFPGT